MALVQPHLRKIRAGGEGKPHRLCGKQDGRRDGLDGADQLRDNDDLFAIGSMALTASADILGLPETGHENVGDRARFHQSQCFARQHDFPHQQYAQGEPDLYDSAIHFVRNRTLGGAVGSRPGNEIVAIRSMPVAAPGNGAAQFDDQRPGDQRRHRRAEDNAALGRGGFLHDLEINKSDSADHVFADLENEALEEHAIDRLGLGHEGRTGRFARHQFTFSEVVP
jgi:hypothetical protein